MKTLFIYLSHKAKGMPITWDEAKFLGLQIDCEAVVSRWFDAIASKVLDAVEIVKTLTKETKNAAGHAVGGVIISIHKKMETSWIGRLLIAFIKNDSNADYICNGPS